MLSVGINRRFSSVYGDSSRDCSKFSRAVGAGINDATKVCGGIVKGAIAHLMDMCTVKVEVSNNLPLKLFPLVEIYVEQQYLTESLEDRGLDGDAILADGDPEVENLKSDLAMLQFITAGKEFSLEELDSLSPIEISRAVSVVRGVFDLMYKRTNIPRLYFKAEYEE